MPLGYLAFFLFRWSKVRFLRRLRVTRVIGGLCALVRLGLAERSLVRFAMVLRVLWRCGGVCPRVVRCEIYLFSSSFGKPGIGGLAR